MSEKNARAGKGILGKYGMAASSIVIFICAVALMIQKHAENVFWYGIVFIAISLYMLISAIAGIAKKEDDAPEKISNMIDGNAIDLRSAASSRGGGMLMHFVEMMRGYFVTITKNLQEFAFNFYSIDRRMQGFLKAFSFMSKNVKDGIVSGKTVYDTVQTQLASTEEISSTAQSLARLASDMNLAMMSANEGAQRGTTKLKEIESTFKSVGESTLGLARQSEDLSTKADTIQDVVRRITGIADQTNLLALNASIEAARAGTAGLGFAVVAEEVKKLADESRSATEQIFTSLSELVEGVQQATENVNSMSSFIGDANTIVQEVITEITSVLGEIGTIGNSSQTVAASAQELGASSQELTSFAQLVAGETDKLRSVLTGIEVELGRLENAAEDLNATTHSGANEASEMIDILKSVKTMTNEDLAISVEDAIRAHKSWIDSLRKSLDNGHADLETDGNKCRFGIFLSSVERPAFVPEKLWREMLDKHNKLHSYGHKVDECLEHGDTRSATATYNEAEALSRELTSMLTGIISSCRSGKLVPYSR